MNDVHKNPPSFLETPLLLGKPSKVPKKDPPMAQKSNQHEPPPKKKTSFVIPIKKHILQKKWSKTAICGLSSGQTILPQPIRGHGHQLDDRHRNPNINIREIIWLGNQLEFN